MDAVEAVLATLLAHLPGTLAGQARVLDALISALCLELVRVRARMAASAAVGRVPDEVLAQVFAHACTAGTYAATSTTAAAVAGTCRRWRAVATTHAALWTRVELRHPSALYALQYSRRLPLHVRLDAPLWKARDDQLPGIVAPHAARIRQLWIQTDAVHASHVLAIAPPQLERLVITGRYTDDAPVVLPALPRLRHLTLVHAHLAQPQPGLLSLALKPPAGAPVLDMAALVAVLRASPALADVDLAGGAVPEYRAGEHPRVELPRLRALRIAGADPVQAAWLLFHISYPPAAALTLALDAPPDRPEAYLAVLTLVRAVPLDTIALYPGAKPAIAYADATLALHGPHAADVVARLASAPLAPTTLVLDAAPPLALPPPDPHSALAHVRVLALRASRPSTATLAGDHSDEADGGSDEADSDPDLSSDAGDNFTDSGDSSDQAARGPASRAATPSSTPPTYMHLRAGWHSASMTNLRSPALGLGVGHCASASNLREAFARPNATHKHSASAAFRFGTPRPSFATHQRSSTFPQPQSRLRPHTPPADDPDIDLLSALSPHMPALEEIKIVRSSIRGTALVNFIKARNALDSDSDSSSDSDAQPRAGPGAPILVLELVECPFVRLEHVRALRDMVDDVRWRPTFHI
ncbi:hypothetical protein CTheo_2863 [Ceratobasidium theobromae]|uniref:F-box domain-containing protein n=1 Tax=Ceratobasidium theobromae TaxID=1582974 RepID=A0A5N5QPI7_9AGAM|nr:hypothetical protein CTheo_2863 [Ceratobasidium theobromae]